MKYRNSLPLWFQEIYEDKGMRRLKEIHMDCGLNYTKCALPDGYRFCELSEYTRFTHSVNVANIIYDFTNDETIALAGLFHDYATPAFSHVVDFLHGDYERQETTESDTEILLKHSCFIPSLLKKHGISLKEVSDYHIYPIADNPSPKLSADRLEYTLTNGTRYGFLKKEEVQEIYDFLCIGVNEFFEPELIVSSREIALKLALVSVQCGKVYASCSDRYAMEFLARLLKQAMDLAILKEADLMQSEKNVIEILNHSILCEEWNHFTKLTLGKQTDETGNECFEVKAKRRYIDPYIKGEGRVSKVVPFFKEILYEYLNENQTITLKGVFEDERDYHCQR